MRSSSQPAFTRPDQGFALVLVLAFVALLIGICLAFFSNAFLQGQISNSSATQVKVDILAQGAVETTVTDLEREIQAGSVPPTADTTFADGSKLYLPLAAKNMIPELAGVTHGTATAPNGLENLFKISKSGTPFFAGDTITRAANSPTTSLSQNGRSISTARWNAPLLLTKANPGSTDDDTPVAAFTAPDWILVSRDQTKPNPQAPDASVVGRYAYAIYDEGGLLDVNVAGYPSATQTSNPKDVARKNALAFADLTQIPGLTSTQIDALVDWRNYATVRDTNSNYAKYVVSNSTGFLQTGNTALSGSQSDQMFTSRQALIDFFNNKLGAKSNAPLQSSLQYLTTFSRALNQPSYIPAVQANASAPVVLDLNKGGNSVATPPYTAGAGDKSINPSFPSVRVQTSTTIRSDGTTAKVGEPLVNKRFALQRLAWITYKGPSADRTQSDPDIQALINDGVPWTYLQQGTADNIKKYFGLSWDGTNNRWKYDVHVGTSGSNKIIMLVGRPAGTGANPSKYVEDDNREPNFFELLKAGITVGSLGKAATTPAVNASLVAPSGYGQDKIPANLRYNFDSSVDYHIIQIGANLLSEVNPTSFPIRIAFDDGGPRGLWEFQGVTDLPYLNYVFNGVVRERAPNPPHPLGGNQAVDNSPHQSPTAQSVALTDPGKAYMVQVPAVWNPYDPNGTYGPNSTTPAPTGFRPTKFRVVIDSNDPLSPSGSGDLPICHFAAGSKSTSPGKAASDGTGPPNAKYSIENDVTLGKSPDKLNGGPGTPIYDAVTFDDSNGTLYREPTLIFDTRSPGHATRVGALNGATPAGNIQSIDDNPLPNSSISKGTNLAPLVLGQMPLAFSFGTNPVTTVYTSSGYIALAAGNGDNRVYFTYRLQYQDPANSNNWITYDTKYGRTTHGLFGFQNNWNQPNPGFSSSVVRGPEWWNAYSWASAIDPRTARFGLFMDLFNDGKSRASFGGAPAMTGWIFDSSGATTTGITYPIRPDNSSGFGFANLDVANVPPGGRFSQPSAGQTLLGMGSYSSKDVPYPSFSAGWTAPVVLDYNGGRQLDTYMFAPGMYAQNNPNAPFYLSSGGETDIQPCYYADADGVVRRATGAYVPSGSGNSATTPVGLPTSSINGYTGKPAALKTPASATPFTQSQSRPLLLHRPFRTVAELGYVFRDVPWKNLDFFTPESGDAALLDLFCINETSDPNGLVAGKVNLNTRQAPVLAAIVSGAYVDDPKITNTTVGSLSTTVAANIATALTERTADTTNYGPLQNPSELVGKWQSAGVITSGTTYKPSGNNWGIDLPSNDYKDGQKSYVGFSGNATATTTGKDLSTIFTPPTAGSLMESMAYVQRFREAPIRALGSVGQTRVWNLMIDVVAQTGRYPQSATGLDKFVVEGEQRYWVHVAIDRLTGKVIDKQIEVVKE